MDATDNTCLVCHEATEIFAFGRCDHPICYKCSTRMRALCEHYYCPTCRTDLPQVFFMYTVEKFGEMPIRKFIANKRYKIQYENEEIQERVEKLLEHKCTTCKQRPAEKSFKALRDHMRRVHSLFYCDLCLGLKIFTRERKSYDRQSLATHRRIGDKDDTSYKGHPLCHFCDERYLDKDELYKHLRKDHYYCHFCESLGSQEYYADYDVLRDHFRKDHYLCEEGECEDVQFENAFKSEIDLKGHRATHHGKGHSKQQSRQERTLNIDINLVPRPSSRPSRGGAGRGDRDERGQHGVTRGRGGGRYGDRYGDRGSNRDQEDVERAIQASLSTMKEEENKKKAKPTEKQTPKDKYVMTVDQFPTLGSQPVSTVASTTSSSSTDTDNSTLADRFAIANNMSVQHGVLGQSDFPSLSSLSSSTPAAPRVPVEDFPVLGSSAKPTIPISRPPYKQNVNGQSRVVNKPTKPVSAFRGKTQEEDYPELPVKKAPQPSLASWVVPGASSNVSTNNSKMPQKKPKPDKVKGSKNAAVSNFVVDDFPSLGQSGNGTYTDKWFKSSKSNVAHEMDDKDVPDHWDDENITTDIKDRYSPVNIPKSPETNKKNKNKKKKKKEKPVTEIKDTETLRNNSSLDDIASLLMASKANSDPTDNNTGSDKVKTEVNGKRQNKQKVQKADNIDIKGDVSVGAVSGGKVVKEANGPDTDVLGNFVSPSKFSEESFDIVETKAVKPKPVKSTKVNEANGQDTDVLSHFVSPSKFSEENFNIAETKAAKPKPVKFSIAEADFPSLGAPVSKKAVAAPTSKKAPPPGFNKSSSSGKMPPGLSKTVAPKPPPGFSSPKLADLSKEMFPDNYSDKKEVIPMSSNPTNFDYEPPENFQYRNKQLIDMVQSACTSPPQFAEFKSVSGEFRRSEISAEKYYVNCEAILGRKFADIFPELLALLPDIRKQQDLLSVFMVKEGINKNDDGVLKISGKSQNAKDAWTMTPSGFLACQTCKQVLVRRDYNKHLGSHVLDSQEFPTLGGTVPARTGGWQNIH